MAKIEINPLVGREILAAGILVAELLKEAQPIAATARQIAPRGTSHEHYADQITVDVEKDRDKIVIARINANDFKSEWIEFGTGAPGPTPAFAPIRRAALMRGHRLQ